jgi:hypothetical protein
VVTVANRLTIAGLTAVAMSMVGAFVFVTDIRSVRRPPWWPASQQGRRCRSCGAALRWLADALSPGPGPPGVSVPQRRAGPAGDLSRIPRAGRTMNRRRYEGYIALQDAIARQALADYPPPSWPTSPRASGWRVMRGRPIGQAVPVPDSLVSLVARGDLSRFAAQRFWGLLRKRAATQLADFVGPPDGSVAVFGGGRPLTSRRPESSCGRGGRRDPIWCCGSSPTSPTRVGCGRRSTGIAVSWRRARSGTARSRSAS